MQLPRNSAPLQGWLMEDLKIFLAFCKRCPNERDKSRPSSIYKILVHCRFLFYFLTKNVLPLLCIFLISVKVLLFQCA